MNLRVRHISIAASAALLASTAVIATIAWAFDDDPQTDGSFVLSEPGIYAEPTPSGRDSPNADNASEQLPDLELSNAEGQPVNLAEYRGTPLVVNLWFSRCAPCARELADFAVVDAQLADDDVAFVGVNAFDTPETMVEFATGRGVEYDLLYDDERQLARQLEIIEYPVTLFVDATGAIIRQTGTIDADELRLQLDQLFDVKPRP